MYDLAALGELLIDFTECGVSEGGQRLFEQNPGGAVANVLCGASRLGLSTAFLGKVGDDMHGHFLEYILSENKVNTNGLILSPDVFTTLAFVSLSKSGEREFSFARKPGADTCLTESEVKKDILKNCKVFHVGSLSLTDEPARSATLSAVRFAKENGAKISYDPNYRALLWKNEQEAKEQIRSLLPYVDIMKISDEETALLTDQREPEEAISYLLGLGVQCVVVTLGKKGAMVGLGSARLTVPTFESAAVVDTTGAGDSFWAAFLSCVIQSGGVSKLDPVKVEEYVRFANAAATFCVGKRGAIPAMPYEADVRNVLKSYSNEK